VAEARRVLVGRTLKDQGDALKAAGEAAIAVDMTAHASGLQDGERSGAPAQMWKPNSATAASSMVVTNDGTLRPRVVGVGSDDRWMIKGAVVDVQDDDFQWYAAHQLSMRNLARVIIDVEILRIPHERRILPYCSHTICSHQASFAHTKTTR